MQQADYKLLIRLVNSKLDQLGGPFARILPRRGPLRAEARSRLASALSEIPPELMDYKVIEIIQALRLGLRNGDIK